MAPTGADVPSETAHITYVVPELAHAGGIQTFARVAAKELSATRGYSVQLADRGDLGHRRAEHVVAEFTGARTRSALALWDQRSGAHPDLTHFWHPSDAWGRSALPYVVTCHGKDVLPSTPPPGWRGRAWRRGLAHASAITTPSRYTADFLVSEHRIPEELVTVVHPAVARRSVVQRPSGGGEGDVVRVGVLSRLEARKNVDRCIEAAELLQDQLGSPVEFHLAGVGPQQEVLRERLDRSRVASVSWGRISEADKWDRFLPALDVFLLPTLASATDVEGFGIVYLEANSVGVPVVASAVGGVPDAVSDGVSGFFADADDAESIADAAARIVSAGAQMRSSAQSWSRRFSAERLAEQLGTVYRQAMAR